MKRKNIVISAAQVPFVRGGAELLTESLFEQLKLRGYNVEIVQLPSKWYPKNQLLNNVFAWRLIDVSESNGQKIDLVIATKFPSYCIEHDNKITWLMHQLRQIYDLHGTKYSDFAENDEDNALRNKLISIDNKCISESKKVYTIAGNVSSRLKKYNNIEAEALYHPPKHVGYYYTDRYDDYILSVGRLDVMKRVDLLIKSLQYCDNKIKAVIAGTGPQREELERLAVKLGVKDRVEFLGFVKDEDLLKLYANAFSIYFAPFDEDYGYITLEAFLSKKPVITCNDSGGVLEFVEDNKSGFVCETEAEKIGEKIQEIWIDKNLCTEFGNLGFEKVKDISWDNVIDKLTETLR